MKKSIKVMLGLLLAQQCIVPTAVIAEEIDYYGSKPIENTIDENSMPITEAPQVQDSSSIDTIDKSEVKETDTNYITDDNIDKKETKEIIKKKNMNLENESLNKNDTDKLTIDNIKQVGNIGTSRWNLSSDGILTIEGGVFNEYAEFKLSTTEVITVKKIVILENVKAGKSLSNLFYNMENLEYIEGLENLDTSDVEDMSNLFLQCYSLKSLDLSNFDTSNVKDMRGMFASCMTLDNIDVSKFNTNSVTDMSDMFMQCYSLKSLILSNFNTSNVKYMSRMFYNLKIEELDLSNFNTSNVTDMSGMFSQTKFASLNLENFDTGKVKDMSKMFNYTTGLNTLNISNFQTGGVKNFSNMFSYSNLTSIDLKNFDTSNGTNMNSMFSSTKLAFLDIANFKTEKVTDMGNMFSNSSLSSIELNKFDTSNVIKMNNMFSNTKISSLDITNFKTEKVTDMSNMFSGSNIVMLNLKNMNTINVQNMNDMFYNCKYLESIELGENSLFSEKTALSIPKEQRPESKFSGGWEIIEEEGIKSFYISDAIFMRDYDGSKPGIYSWQTNKNTLTIKNTEIYEGNQWLPKDNLVYASNKYGETIEVTELDVKGTVDTAKAGIYEVTYINGSLSETAKVTVKGNKASLKVKDSTLYVGDKWAAKDNFVSGTDEEGETLAVGDLEIEGKVDTSKAGVYEVTYKNGSLSETAKVTVKENKASLKVKDSTLYVGDKWAAKDTFVSGTDKDGKTLSVDDLEIEGKVDTSKAGVYKVTYKNVSLSETAKVTVKENKATLKVKDLTLYVGESWMSGANLVSATDKDGNVLAVGDLEVEGIVDTKIAGVYEVTYKNGSLSETAKVTVKENKASLKVKDSTLYVGDKWEAKNNLDSATDKDGKTLAVGDLEVEGTVDTKIAGVYEVTYKNGSLSETAKVTVKENKASLKVKDLTLYVGDSWISGANLVSATDKDGKTLAVDDLEVEGTVDTKIAGVYEVTYKNGNLSETAKVTVKENKASLKVKDSTMYVGDQWAAKDNFVSGTDKDGKILAVDDLEIEGTVDTSKAGVYEVTYKNGSLSETAKVTVKENKATLKVKDLTLYVGESWISAANFVSATDKDGKTLSVDDLEVEGTVDTKIAGVYEVTYKNGSLSETAKVIVKENKASLKVKDSTLYVGDKWAAKDTFVSGTDKDGKTLSVDDLEIEGTVDTSKAGVYEVTYKNVSLSETAKVTVKNSNDSNVNQDNRSDNKMKVKKIDNNLPKTGEKQNKWMNLLGFSFFSVGFFYQRKYKKKR